VSTPAPVDAIRDRLRTDLRAAMRARDRDVTAALRGALAAVDGAEAVPAAGHEASVGHLGEAARATLTEQDIVEALTAELREHQRAADLYRGHGDHDTAAAMQTRADTVARFLPPT
jgi:uncharacterized protein